MLNYSAYFINDAGHIVGVVSLGSRTEDEALAAGLRLLVGQSLLAWKSGILPTVSPSWIAK